MARIQYTYKTFPGCERATRYSKEREESAAKSAGLIGTLTIGAVIAFIVCAVDVFQKGIWENFLYSSLVIVFVGLLDWYFFICRPNNTECELNVIVAEDMSAKNMIPMPSGYVSDLRKKNRQKNIKSLGVFSAILFAALIVVFGVIGLITLFV